MKPIFLLGAVFSMVLGVAYASGYRLNVTPSLEQGIYRLSSQPPRRGDIVAFCLSGPDTVLAASYVQPGSCPSGLRPLMKYLTGMPSDVVRIEENGILCGPAQGPRCFWPVRIRETDSKGRPVVPATIEGIVPDGMALVLTDHEGGFDSRYFGFVPLDSMKKMEPMWTLPD